MGKKSRAKKDRRQLTGDAQVIDDVIDRACLLRDAVRARLDENERLDDDNKRALFERCDQGIRDLRGLIPSQTLESALRESGPDVFGDNDGHSVDIPSELVKRFERAMNLPTSRSCDWAQCLITFDKMKTEISNTHVPEEVRWPEDSYGDDDWAPGLDEALASVDPDFKGFFREHLDYFVRDDEFDVLGFEALREDVLSNGWAHAAGKLRRRRCATCCRVRPIYRPAYLTCAGCCGPNYCSRWCQRDDWVHGGHSKLCLANGSGDDVPEDFRALCGRYLLTRSSPGNGFPDSLADVYEGPEAYPNADGALALTGVPPGGVILMNHVVDPATGLALSLKITCLRNNFKPVRGVYEFSLSASEDGLEVAGTLSLRLGDADRLGRIYFAGYCTIFAKRPSAGYHERWDCGFYAARAPDTQDDLRSWPNLYDADEF